MSEEMQSNEPMQQANVASGAIGENSVGTTTAVGEATNTQSIDTSFRDLLPDEYKNEPSLSSIKDIGSLAKGYVHAQKELGGRIRIPGPDASPEVKAEFAKKMEQAGFIQAPDLNDPNQKEQLLNKLGRPETPDGYDMEIPEELGAVVNEQQLGSYRELAHKIGLNKEQAKALLEYDINRTMETMETSQQTARQTLQSEWGDAFNQRLELSKDALRHFEAKYPDAVAAIKSGPSGNNPVVLMMAAELGKMYKESGIVVGNRPISFGMTPTEAQARIREVMSNQSHAYHNDADPGHYKAVDMVAELYKAAYPDNNSK